MKKADYEELARSGELLWVADLGVADEEFEQAYFKWIHPFEYMSPSEWAKRDDGVRPTWVLSYHYNRTHIINFLVPDHVVIEELKDKYDDAD